MQACPKVPQVEAIKGSQVDEEVLATFWSNCPFPRVVRITGYISGALSTSCVSMLPSLTQTCGRELGVSMFSLLWGWSSHRLRDWATSSLWQRTNLNQSHCLFLLCLHQWLCSGPADWNTSRAENLCPNMSWFGFPATEICLLGPLTWQVYAKSSYSFELCPLFLAPFPTNRPICPSCLDSCTLIHKLHIPSVIRGSTKAPAFGRGLKAAGNKGINGTCEHV